MRLQHHIYGYISDKMVETRRQAKASKEDVTDSNGNMSDQPNDGSESAQDADRLPSVAFVVFLSLIIDLLAFTMILPLLPALLEYYGTHDKVKRGFFTFYSADFM